MICAKLGSIIINIQGIHPMGGGETRRNADEFKNKTFFSCTTIKVRCTLYGFALFVSFWSSYRQGELVDIFQPPQAIKTPDVFFLF